MSVVSVMSDLHLEFADIELPGGDILLLPGDIFLAASLKPEVTGGQYFLLKQRAIRFAEEELKKYRYVIHVSGNHENYHECLQASPTIVKRFLKKYAPHAIHLNNKSVDIEGVRFIGSTLWATYGYGTPSAGEIERSMSDFALIKFWSQMFMSKFGTFRGGGYAKPAIWPLADTERYSKPIGFVEKT